MKRSQAIIAALVAFLPRLASAQTAPDPTFEEGRVLLDQGRFAEACARFQTTWDSHPTPGKAFNLSVCEGKQHHMARAVHWMNEGMALLEPNDTRRPGAVVRRSDLEKHEAFVVITSADRSLAVTLDSDRVELGVKTAIDAGAHTLIVKAEGHQDGHQTVSLVEGQVQEIGVQAGPVVGATPSVVSPPQPTAPAVQTPARGSDTQRIAGVTLMAVGGASLIGFGALAGVVASKHSHFEKAVPGSPAANDLASSGKHLEIGEGVLLGLGIAAGAVGITVFATAPSKAPSTTGITIRPSIHIGETGGSCGVVGSF